MIVWVASFPRSGNTITMRTLYEVYGIHRLCSYARKGLFMQEYEGEKGRPEGLEGRNNDELIDQLRELDEAYFIKTHAPKHAEDPAPALYVVRDGRDVHVSHAHWVKGRGIEPFSSLQFKPRLNRLVRRGHWSRHVTSFLDRKGPTAILRFEELLADSAAAVKKGCDELGIELPKPVGQLTEFDKLAARNPTNYRRGKAGSWQDEMPAHIERRFWLRHGEIMQALGYETPDGMKVGGLGKRAEGEPQAAGDEEATDAASEDLPARPKAELKEMAKELGLPVGGTKDDLIARIRESRAEDDRNTGDLTPPDTEPEPGS